MIVDSALYREGSRIPLDCPPDDFGALRKAAAEEGDFVWVGLYEPTEDELGVVAKAFGLHPLAVEDTVKAHQRPKLEQYGDTLFLVLKTLWYVDADDAVETGEIHLFTGPDFAITVRHGSGSELKTARQRLEAEEALLGHGPPAVLYAVCDTVVDGYTSVVSDLQVDVDEVEQSVFSPARTENSARIYILKREIAEVRRAVIPLRDPMRRFASGQIPGVNEKATPFFRDVDDHLARAAELVESLDTLLSSAFDAYLARISIQQNNDMRKISAAVGLAAVPTLVAGIYGMNFQHMPELRWTYGYPYALGLMIVIVVALWIWFKRSGWL